MARHPLQLFEERKKNIFNKIEGYKNHSSKIHLSNRYIFKFVVFLIIETENSNFFVIYKTKGLINC